MKKTLVLGVLVLASVCLWFANPHPARAAGGTDNWAGVPANCQGAKTDGRHVCEFIHTQVRIGADANPFDQWTLVAIEPGIVADVTCTTHGTNIFRILGSAPPQWGGNKANPWKGSHYGDVAVCSGWINGGIGPVDMSVIYQ